MNCIIYVPHKDGHVYWQYAGSSVEEVREILKSAAYADGRPRPMDGIYEMYCHDEGSYPVQPEQPLCDHCGREGTDDNPVFSSNDPYTAELHPNEHNPRTNWCQSCYHEACMDI